MKEKLKLHIITLMAFTVFIVLGLACATTLPETGNVRSSSVRASVDLHITNVSGTSYWVVFTDPLPNGRQEFGTKTAVNVPPNAVYSGVTVYQPGEREVYYSINTTGKASQDIEMRGVGSFRSWPKKTVIITIDQLSNGTPITVSIP